MEASRRGSEFGHLANKSSSPQEEDVGKSGKVPSKKRAAVVDNSTPRLAREAIPAEGNEIISALSLSNDASSNHYQPQKK